VAESLPPEDPRDALIREQAALIAALSAQVTDLSAQLAELTGLVRELRGQLEAARRAASRNSGNSSMPPSSDDLPGRKAPAPRAKPGSGRRPGKQPGAPVAMAQPTVVGRVIATGPRSLSRLHMGRGRARCGAAGKAAQDQWLRLSSKRPSGERWPRWPHTDRPTRRPAVPPRAAERVCLAA
jgi:hypothetical protein